MKENTLKMLKRGTMRIFLAAVCKAASRPTTAFRCPQVCSLLLSHKVTSFFLSLFLSFLSTDAAGSLPSSNKPLTLSQTHSAVFFLNKLKHNSLQRRKVETPAVTPLQCLHSTEERLIKTLSNTVGQSSRPVSSAVCLLVNVLHRIGSRDG